jgi:exonuclease III
MPLRILSYNILAGGADRLPLISNVIRQQQADVVALMEARNCKNVEALAKQLGMSLTFYLATLRERGDDRLEPQFPRQVIPLLLEAGYVDCYRALHPTTPGYTSTQRIQLCGSITSSPLQCLPNACMHATW